MSDERTKQEREEDEGDDEDEYEYDIADETDSTYEGDDERRGQV